jgi:hypothetical protein
MHSRQHVSLALFLPVAAAVIAIPAETDDAFVPYLQGDPTFLYGGYGYRPPSFGYAWTGAQTTSFAQLPTDTSSSKALSPKALSK